MASKGRVTRIVVLAMESIAAARKHPDDGKALRDLPAAGTFDQKSIWTLNLKNRPSRTSVGASQLSYAKL